MSDAHLLEHELGSEEIFAGNLLRLRRDRVRLPDGGEGTREYVVHPGAALIVPVLDDGRLVLERQYRHPVGHVILEFPAGKIDFAETALATAQRELTEEAGYTAQSWTQIATLHPNVGYSTERIEVFLAQTLTHVGARLDQGEFLDVIAMTQDQLIAAFDHGEFTDGKSVAALFALQRHWARMRASIVARTLAVHGRVQGVGFRYYAVERARELGVAGWVQNRADGSVEAFVQGEPPAVAEFVAWCRQGPAAARVNEVMVTTVDPVSGMTGFAQHTTT